MLWIGLTGGIATGKSTASRWLRDRGYEVVDADQLAREVVEIGMPALTDIAQAFGPEVLLASGELDRKKLADIIFADPAKRKVLEDITHPRIRQLTEQRRRQLAAQGRLIGFYDVPLLFEKQLQRNFDRTLVIACSRETQKQRLITRDGLSEIEAERRLNAQLPIDEKMRLADDVIKNESTLEALGQGLESYLKSLLG